MASYQDIETRVQVLERKVDFVMKQFKLGMPNGSVINPQMVIKSILDLYNEAQTGVIGEGEVVDAGGE